MNKCVVIPGHVQIKIQQLPSIPESKNQQLIIFLFNALSLVSFKILGR